MGKQIFGYIDESGAPGVASCNKDYLLVALVLFDSEESKAKSINKIDKLTKKLHLPDDYEFHCSSNSTRPQREFLKLLSGLDFRFITIAIRKNDFRKTASYARIAHLLADKIEKRFINAKIEMDSNPVFRAALRKEMRSRDLRDIKIRERNSRHSRFIQIADYVVNICSKKVKNTPKGLEWYKLISKKMLAFVEIAE